MAEENKNTNENGTTVPAENTTKEEERTSIKKIKEPDFSKEVVIDRLVADKQALDLHYNRMKKAFGDKLSDEEINKRIRSLVIRDNIFDRAMHIIIPCYEIKISPKDLSNVTEMMTKADPRLAKAPYQYVKSIATRLMEKEMLFAVLAKEWKVEVTDEELQTHLNEYYKMTNKPIRDIVNNKQQMDSIRRTILDQKIADAICRKLSYKMDDEAIRKNAEASRKAYEEAMAKAQANAKITDESKKN